MSILQLHPSSLNSTNSHLVNLSGSLYWSLQAQWTVSSFDTSRRCSLAHLLSQGFPRTPCGQTTCQTVKKTKKQDTWLNIYLHLRLRRSSVMPVLIPMPSACASPVHLTSHPAWRSRWLRQYFLPDINFKGCKKKKSSRELVGYGGRHVCVNALAWNAAESPPFF